MTTDSKSFFPPRRDEYQQMMDLAHARCIESLQARVSELEGELLSRRASDAEKRRAVWDEAIEVVRDAQNATRSDVLSFALDTVIVALERRRDAAGEGG